jgi:phenylalanyl-tRNA synthetase beta chain
VRGLEMTDDLVRSLMQLQEAIDLTIGRDRVKSAIGIHDFSRVKPPFTYREVGPREISFVPLGLSREMTIEQILKEHPKGIQYRHIFARAKAYPIILDSRGDVVSFPPIINGELTKVTPDTRDIFMDITGHEKAPLRHALNILICALEMRGGRIEAVRINGKAFPDLRSVPMKLDRDSVKRTLGLNLKDSEISQCLERMGYAVNLKAGKAYPPPYRADIMHPADVIEDVAIAYGYNDFIPEVPRLPTIGRPSPREESSIRIKELMTGLGFQEVVNLSLSSEERQFASMGMKNPGAVEISNPVSGDYSLCRHWLLPSLLGNLASNIHRRYPQRIFEAADCIRQEPIAETRTKNVRMLSAVSSHAGAGFSEIASFFNALREALPGDLSTRESAHPSFIRGRCASILLGRKEIGFMGELSPAVLASFGLKMPVAAMELRADAFMA